MKNIGTIFLTLFSFALTSGAVTIGDDTTVNSTGSGVGSLKDITFSGSSANPVTAVFLVDSNVTLVSGAANWDYIDMYDGNYGKIKTAAGATLTTTYDFAHSVGGHLELDGNFIFNSIGGPGIGGYGGALSVGGFDAATLSILAGTKITCLERGIVLDYGATLVMDVSAQIVCTGSLASGMQMDFAYSGATLKLTGTAQNGQTLITCGAIGSSDSSSVVVNIDIGDLDTSQLLGGDSIVLIDAQQQWTTDGGYALDLANFVLVGADRDDLVLGWANAEQTILELVAIPEGAHAAALVSAAAILFALRRKKR